jgi:hypothetical protein
MNLPAEPDRWTVEIANAQREEALAAFGLTERQARFLGHVLAPSTLKPDGRWSATHLGMPSSAPP